VAYGIKYKITIKNRQWTNDICDVYVLNIYQKDYLGILISLEGADKPFVLKYQSGDDNKPVPIRASECETNFWNDGTLPLSTFYSEDDEEYRFDFLCYSIEDVVQNKLLWSGYMVQDNCQEQFAFPPYVVTLKGTDNLALLKEVALNTAFNESALRKVYESSLSADITISGLNTIAITEPLIVVSEDTTKMNVLNYGGIDYTIASASYDAGAHVLTLIIASPEEFPANGTFTGQSYTIYTTPNIFGKVSLYDIFTVLLSNTGISLPLRVYANIYENTTHDRGDDPVATFLEQTYVHCGEFQNEDGTWQDCYSILEKILFAFNGCLFQAEGVWVLMRYCEASLFTDNKILGTEFPADLISAASAVTLDPNVEFDKDAEIIFFNANQITRINRPFKDVKLTFNYVQPKNLIRNINLDEQGVLLNTSTISDPGQPDDGYIVREYSLPYWFETGFSGQPTVFLRVISSPVIDSVDEIEVERYIVLSGGTYGGPYLRSSSFFLDKNDRVKISFTMRTKNSQNGPSNNDFVFRTVNGGTEYKINFNNGVTTDGSWATGAGAVFTYSSTDDIGNWTNFEVDSLGAPVDGYFDIGLNQLDFSGTIEETHYKDFRIEYIPYINETSRIIGQYHLQHQPTRSKIQMMNKYILMIVRNIQLPERSLQMH
jgi:hypothetical protein